MKASRFATFCSATVLAATGLFTGCGYTSGFGNPHGIRSVAIQTVEDLSYRREIAELLTRQLGRDVQRFTGLVPGRSATADAELLVTVLSATGRSVVEGNGGSIAEGAIGLDAEVQLIARDGRVLHRERYLDWAEYRAPVGETRSAALREAVADLSRRILLGLDADFVSRDPKPRAPEPDSRRSR